MLQAKNTLLLISGSQVRFLHGSPYINQGAVSSRQPMRRSCLLLTTLFVLTLTARVAELADAPDLGSGGQSWGFKSPLSHQINKLFIERSSEQVFLIIMRPCYLYLSEVKNEISGRKYQHCKKED